MQPNAWNLGEMFSLPTLIRSIQNEIREKSSINYFASAGGMKIDIFCENISITEARNSMFCSR